MKRVTLQQLSERTGWSAEKIGHLVTVGRLPPLKQYRVPRREPFDYWETPVIERALMKIIRDAERLPA